ncbi:MAG: MBL fold metallo-hydrolase [Acidimicrobiia bacterium]|nr:MBL fold metallo-hydrolase [Acidimicrobiia bacterium]
MIFEHYYLDCLSQASYLVADETTKVAAVVDPQRDIEQYLADAEAQGLTIAYVIETHFHADFLSGHLELAEATGAEIIYGSAAEPDFAIRKVTDGERLALGEGPDGVVLEFRETPGHTPESISIVVWERATDAQPHAVLTGDTLFIGDVGRPDLLASVGVTADELARSLHSSLHDKLLTLPDETLVYPAHGAGSACGKSLSTEKVSTIGEQRTTNYALAPMDVDAFVEVVTEGQATAPGYFGFNASLNKADRELLDTTPPDALSIEEVLAARADGAAVIDTRDPISFAAGHLRDAINVGLDGRFAEYVGTVVAPRTPIVLITEPGTEVEAKLRLGRIGFDTVLGALEGGAAALADRPELTERASRLSAARLAERRDESPVHIIDIRNPGETALGTIDGAERIPLGRLRTAADDLPLDEPIVVYCAGGYRSSIASSLLRSMGATDVSDLLGGFGAWVTAQTDSTAAVTT